MSWCDAVEEQGAHCEPPAQTLGCLAGSHYTWCPAQVPSPSHTHLHLQPKQHWWLLATLETGREARGRAGMGTCAWGAEVSAFQREEYLPLPWSVVTSSDPSTPIAEHSECWVHSIPLQPLIWGKPLQLAQDLIADNKASFCSENCCLSQAPQPLSSCFHRKPMPSPHATASDIRGVQQPSLGGWGSALLRGPPHPFCHRSSPGTEKRCLRCCTAPHSQLPMLTGSV